MARNFSLSKLLNLITDNLDASIVTRVQLEYALAVEVSTVELLSES